jgi:hypothetical protein
LDFGKILGMKEEHMVAAELGVHAGGIRRTLYLSDWVAFFEVLHYEAKTRDHAIA